MSGLLGSNQGGSVRSWADALGPEFSTLCTGQPPALLRTSEPAESQPEQLLLSTHRLFKSSPLNKGADDGFRVVFLPPPTPPHPSSSHCFSPSPTPPPPPPLLLPHWPDPCSPECLTTQRSFVKVLVNMALGATGLHI